MNSSNKYIRDSCQLRKGEFLFSGSIAEPCMADFFGHMKSQSRDDLNFTDIYIAPTKIQAIFKVNDFKHGEIAGFKPHNEFATYNKQSENLRAKWAIVFDALDTAKAKNDIAKIEFITNHQIPLYQRESDNLRFHFIRQYPGSLVSAYLLNYRTYELTIDSLVMFYSLFTPNTQQSRDGKMIEEYIAKEENLLPGNQAPDFTQTDANGNNISLKDYRGKYVLLDFGLPGVFRVERKLHI